MSEFWVSARRFSSTKNRLTGGEIKKIADVSPIYPLYRDNGPHFSSHEAVGDGELVEVDKAHFYGLIPATYHR